MDHEYNESGETTIRYNVLLFKSGQKMSLQEKEIETRPERS
jgi:hypothetical protein